MPFYSNLLGSAGVNQPVTTYEISRSVRFNSADSAYLNRTPASAGNQKTWTISVWIKRSSLSGSNFIVGVPGTTDSTYFEAWFTSAGSLSISGYFSYWLQSVPVYRDPSAWYHLLISVDTTQAIASDRFKVYMNGDLLVGGYTVSPSLNSDLGWNRAAEHRIGRGAASTYGNHYLADFHSIDGQALDPTSFGEFDTNGIWQPIEYTGTYGTNGFHLDFDDNSTAAALGTDTSGAGNNWTVNNIRGFSSTGNYAAYVYASNATYDGTATGTSYYTGAGSQFNGFDGATNTYVGGENVAGSWVYFRPTPSLSGVSQLRVFAQSVETIYVNGSAATVSPSLPDGTSQWYSIVSPPATVTEIAVQGQVASAAAARFSAIEVNGVVLIDNSFAASDDSLVDTPTSYGTDTGAGGEVRGNYATLNPLDKRSTAVLSNGNLETTNTSRATIAIPPSGKWYCEVSATADFTAGISRPGSNQETYVGGSGGNSYGYSSANGYVYFNSSVVTAQKAGLTSGDIMGVAFDSDAATLYFYKNGVLQHTLTSLTGQWSFAAGNWSGATSIATNFGQRPFAYTAPSGFKALCTTNLPDPQTITTSGSYTGNGVADGPFVYLNGVPTAMTVNGNAVTFGTEADKLSNGFKIRTTSTTYNQNASTYNYSITSTGDPFKIARAQANP